MDEIKTHHNCTYNEDPHALQDKKIYEVFWATIVLLNLYLETGKTKAFGLIISHLNTHIKLGFDQQIDITDPNTIIICVKAVKTN